MAGRVMRWGGDEVMMAVLVEMALLDERSCKIE